jgi:Cdc6-like AAA superfamily ATPase
MIANEFMLEKYKLKQKPFKDRIAREKWLETWTNREKEVRQWEEIISHSVSADKNYLAFIIGDYGQGKTLSLMKIEKTAKEYKEILPLLLNFKGEERAKAGLDFIFRVFRSIDFGELGERKHDDLRNAIEIIPDRFEETRTILEKIHFGEGETKRLALYFLRGEISSPTQSQLKKLEVLRKIDGIDIAKEHLAGFLMFIKGLGYTTLLLAIDEFEYLFALAPRTQHGIYLALLRGLYDFTAGMGENADYAANMVLFIAISESGWTYLDDLEKREASIGGPIVPLLRRIDDTIRLYPFDKKQTRELIEKRLAYNRVEGKFKEQPLVPFSEDFVDFISEDTKGAIAKIIVRCDHVLDAGLAERVPLLDKEFAKRVLEERGF